MLIHCRLVGVVASSKDDLKRALTKYHALLHYADIKHPVLLSLLPNDSSSLIAQPTISILSSFPLALIRFVLFIPPLLLHLPGYIMGSLLAKCLATPGEEESPAQFKSVGGGLGIGMNLAAALGILWKKNKLGTLSALLGLGTWSEDETRISTFKRVFGLVGTIYVSVLVLVKWHKLLVGGKPPFLRVSSQLLIYHSQLQTVSISCLTGKQC